MEMFDFTPEGTWRSSKSNNADLDEKSIIISITHAATNRDKIKFTIETKTTMKEFERNQFSVTRLHEEFMWLHDSYIENARYAGILIPPCPCAPNFEGSREKLVTLTEGQDSLPSHELAQTRQELEAEYLSIFEKAVTVHENFLTRLAFHPLLKLNHDFLVFLEYDKERGKSYLLFDSLPKVARFMLEQDNFCLNAETHGQLVKAKLRCLPGASEFGLLFNYCDDEMYYALFQLNIREKNTGELIVGFFRGITKNADESLVLLACRQDTDLFFPSKKRFLSEFCVKTKDSIQTIDAVTTAQKNCANSYSRISSNLRDLSKFENAVSSSREARLNRIIFKTYEGLEKIKMLEAKSASDMDLKLAGLLRYACQDSQACQDLLCRRWRCLADREHANKELTRAQVKKRNVEQAKKNLEDNRQRFESLSETAKGEVMDFDKRRVATFRQNLIQLGKLQIKHCKEMILTLSYCISSIEEM